MSSATLTAKGFPQSDENIINRGPELASSSYPQQPAIEWYFINPHATYYRNTTDVDSNKEKIVVNVINDDSPSKSNNNKKQSYTSSNTIIGSETMEDLAEVIKNQRSTSMIERVVIIDRLDVDSPGKSAPVSPSTVFATQQPTYYNAQQLVYQQPKIHTLIPSNIFLTTTYVANASSFYPFVYFQY